MEIRKIIVFSATTEEILLYSLPLLKKPFLDKSPFSADMTLSRIAPKNGL